MLSSLIYRLKRLLGLTPQEPSVHLADVLGFEPENAELYRVALTHSSCQETDEQGNKVNNERLEYLGDSVLSTAINHYLYREHPQWTEGEMTKRRAMLVGRVSNNAVAKRMGLHRLLRSAKDPARLGGDAYGNALEALVGAIFLDRGYEEAEGFVFSRILPLFRELEDSLSMQTTNFRSLLLEWSQKQRVELEYRMLQEPKRIGATFVCAVYVDGERVAIGRGGTKKESQRQASYLALVELRKHHPELEMQIP